MSRIQELARIIATHTDLVDQYLISKNQPSPSFDINGPATLSLPADLQKSRDLVIEATTELKELLQGPKNCLLTNSSSHMLSLRAIYHYRMAHVFPVGSEATFQQISETCGLNEPDVRRILRHSIAYRVFREIRKGVVVHTGASQILAENKQLQAWLGAYVEEMWPSAVQTVPAMIRWPNSQEPFHTGFNIANDTQDSFYVALGKEPPRASRFAEGMSSLATGPGYEMHHVVDHSLWTSIPGGLVVDLGGSHGDFMIALAETYTSLKFVVQDLPRTIESRPKLPPNLESRITFMPHDFLTEQPIKDADVYTFRWILHNWSDKYALLILRNLIPALKPNARILINDGVLPEPNTLPIITERALRSLDMAMLGTMNSRERDCDDWERLIVDADPRFKFLGIQQPPGSRFALIEAIWEPTQLVAESDLAIGQYDRT